MQICGPKKEDREFWNTTSRTKYISINKSKGKSWLHHEHRIHKILENETEELEEGCGEYHRKEATRALSLLDACDVSVWEKISAETTWRRPKPFLVCFAKHYVSKSCYTFMFVSMFFFPSDSVFYLPPTV